MSLNISELTQLCDMAKKAVLSAGKIIESAQGTHIDVHTKDGGTSLASNIVSEIDLKAQEAILNILSPTMTKYNLGLLTEESQDDESRFNKDYFWCIDPLDGTLPFSQNRDGYSTSIALVTQKGQSILGVINDPRNQNLYYAIKGQGAFKNDSPFKVNENRNDEVFMIDDSMGGAVMNALKTIEMAPAVYIKVPKENKGGGSLWDFAATSIIQKEAGGYNCDYYGDPLELNSKDTFMNKKGVIYASSKKLKLPIS